MAVSVNMVPGDHNSRAFSKKGEKKNAFGNKTGYLDPSGNSLRDRPCVSVIGRSIFKHSLPACHISGQHPGRTL